MLQISFGDVASNCSFNFASNSFPFTQQSVNKSTTIQLSATANGLNLHEARWTDIGSPDAGDDSADGD